MEIEIIPDDGLYVWLGSRAHFYWIGSGDDSLSDFLSDVGKGSGLRRTWDEYVDCPRESILFICKLWKLHTNLVGSLANLLHS